jgi:UDP-N-acetylglucosamine transferase subunit ALG13
VIFVTVGTHQQGFERLLDGLAPLAEIDDLVVQHGHAPAPTAECVAIPFVGWTELVAYMEQASVVVTHGGVGSILVARRAGHVPVVVPRRRAHGEHVDDHQLEIVRCLERRREVVAVHDVDDLADAVRSVPAVAVAPDPLACNELPTAVRLALRGPTRSARVRRRPWWWSRPVTSP